MPEEQTTTTAAEPEPAHFIQVDGTWLPGVREYNFVLEDIDGDDSNRSEDGVMHRTVIKQSVYHASITHICNETNMEAICAAVKTNIEFEATVLCPGRGSPTETMTVYCSKLDAHFVTNTSGDWWQVSYQLVEVGENNAQSGNNP